MILTPLLTDNSGISLSCREQLLRAITHLLWSILSEKRFPEFSLTLWENVWLQFYLCSRPPKLPTGGIFCVQTKLSFVYLVKVIWELRSIAHMSQIALHVSPVG